MAIAERYEQEAGESLRGQVQTLLRVVGSLNERIAQLNPESHIGGLRRKVLELDRRIATIERGDLAIPYSRPYSE